MTASDQASTAAAHGRVSEPAASDPASQAAASDRTSKVSASPVVTSASDMHMRRNEARKQRQQLLEQEKRISDSITASFATTENSPAIAPTAPPPRPHFSQLDERTRKEQGKSRRGTFGARRT